MRNVFCCFCLLFAGILPLAGQSESGGDKPRKPGRSAWFACVSSIPDGVENPVKVMAGKEITKVKLDQYMASEPIKIPEDGIIRIVHTVPDPANPEKPKYLVLAEAKIPETVREALIILIPLPKPDGDQLFRAGIQDLAGFKGGDRLFINLSDTNIGVKIGDTSVSVPAKKVTIYSSPKLAEPANMPIVYSYFHSEQNKWKLLTATTVVIMPTRREICVFNNGARIGKIKKHGILFPVRMEQPIEEPQDPPGNNQ